MFSDDLKRPQKAIKDRIEVKNLTRMFKTTEMGLKKKPTRESIDPKTEKQFREERIARELLQAESKTQLPKPTRKIVDIDDENATLASM